MPRRFDNYEQLVEAVQVIFPDAVFDEDGTGELFILTGMSEAPNGEILPYKEAREMWANKEKKYNA